MFGLCCSIFRSMAPFWEPRGSIWELWDGFWEVDGKRPWTQGVALISEAINTPARGAAGSRGFGVVFGFMGGGSHLHGK